MLPSAASSRPVIFTSSACRFPMLPSAASNLPVIFTSSALRFLISALVAFRSSISAFWAISSFVRIRSAVTTLNLASLGDSGAFAFSVSVIRWDRISTVVSPPKVIFCVDTSMDFPTALISFFRFRISAAVFPEEFAIALFMAT